MIETYFKVVIDEETEAENIQSRTGEIYTEISEMCDKLNQLSKENEQLKQLIKKVLETTPMKHKLAIELKNSVGDLYD